MNSENNSSGTDPRIDQSAFIFDLRSILAPSPSTFSAPKISATMLNRLDYLSKLTYGAVAIISDREISKMKEVLHSAADNLFLIGSYGGELKTQVGAYKSSRPSDEIASARAEINSFVDELKPAYTEDKKLSIAVHFGAAPEFSGTIYKKLSRICKSLGNRFQVVEGHYCWELKEAVHNKGTALAELLKSPEFSGRKAFFFGSDPSAEPAFLTTKLVEGNAVYVGQHKDNTRAAYQLPDSIAVEEWLKRLCVTQTIPELQAEPGRAKSKAA